MLRDQHDDTVLEAWEIILFKNCMTDHLDESIAWQSAAIVPNQQHLRNMEKAKSILTSIVGDELFYTHIIEFDLLYYYLPSMQLPVASLKHCLQLMRETHFDYNDYLAVERMRLENSAFRKMEPSHVNEILRFISPYIDGKKLRSADLLACLNILATGLLSEYISSVKYYSIFDEREMRLPKEINSSMLELEKKAKDIHLSLYLENYLTSLIATIKDILSYRSYWAELGNPNGIERMREYANDPKLSNLQKWGRIVFAANEAQDTFTLFSLGRREETTKLYHIVSEERSLQKETERLDKLQHYLKNMKVVMVDKNCQRRDEVFEAEFFKL